MLSKNGKEEHIAKWTRPETDSTPCHFLVLSVYIPMLRSFLAVHLFVTSVYAVGEPCNPSNNRLDVSDHHFLSDCPITEFCSAVPVAPLNATGTNIQQDETLAPQAPGLGDLFSRDLITSPAISSVNDPTSAVNATTSSGWTCQARGCRKDEYPFG